jgi:hypothetical protein
MLINAPMESAQPAGARWPLVDENRLRLQRSGARRECGAQDGGPRSRTWAAACRMTSGLGREFFWSSGPAATGRTPLVGASASVFSQRHFFAEVFQRLL